MFFWMGYQAEQGALPKRSWYHWALLPGRSNTMLPGVSNADSMIRSLSLTGDSTSKAVGYASLICLLNDVLWYNSRAQ